MGAQSERWSGRAGFILAAIGGAVGLGSIWKFPYEVGANGGGAFVLCYVLGLALVVVPLMLAEFALGRRGAADAATSLERAAATYGASPRWSWLGVFGIVTGLLILSFYSVIGGWTLASVVDTARAGLPGASPGAVRARFDALLASPLAMTGYHALFLALTAAVVWRGVRGGIEAACTVLMPLLAALMLVLAAYASLQGGLRATLAFLFRFELAALTPRVALEALGLGFFSIGVGIGLMITYAAYAGQEIDLRQAAIVSVAADTAISFLAGFAVFPLVFAHGLDPAGGAGLVFVTLPIAFARMPFGTLAALAFFVLLFVAAFASAISLLELAVALLVRRFGWRRPAATAALAAGCFLGGIATVLSFNLWSGWHPLAALPAFAKATAFDLLDHLTSNLMLPLGGFLLAVFAGWVLPASLLAAELRLGPAGAARLRWVLRYVVPMGIAAVALAPLLAQVIDVDQAPRPGAHEQSRFDPPKEAQAMRKTIAGSLLLGALLLPGGAGAQSVADNLKKACNKELTTFCKGVVPGEGRVLACLYAFENKVSDKCSYAVYDAALELEKAVAALKYAAGQCNADLQKYCADVKPGQGRGLTCLKKNDKNVSQGCKDALKQTGLRK
jgi:NSS family neurotransmitter:Na+ symporter